MKLRLFPVAAATCAALFTSCLPSFALQTVTLPQGTDGYTPFQDPDSQAQSNLSTDKRGETKGSGLGSFHFTMSSGAGWPNDPGYYYRPGSSSSAGYGSANVPGSEFYNSGYPSFPH